MSDLILPSRRRFLAGLFVAPAIIAAPRLMKIVRQPPLIVNVVNWEPVYLPAGSILRHTGVRWVANDWPTGEDDYMPLEIFRDVEQQGV